MSGTLNQRCSDKPTHEMLHAFEQFNEGRFWEQHETLEGVWRAEKDESIRNFYKGVLQVGVGFHHLKRRNYRGAVKVLTRGIHYLEPYRPQCMGVEVERLVVEASQVLASVIALGPDGIAQFDLQGIPQLRYQA